MHAAEHQFGRIDFAEALLALEGKQHVTFIVLKEFLERYLRFAQKAPWKKIHNEQDESDILQSSSSSQMSHVACQRLQTACWSNLSRQRDQAQSWPLRPCDSAHERSGEITDTISVDIYCNVKDARMLEITTRSLAALRRLSI